MESIFEVAARRWLSFSLPKSSFFPTRITFVGVDVGKYHNFPDKNKHELLKTWPAPVDVQAVASFIAFGLFYMKWIPYYEVKIIPLRLICAESLWDKKISPKCGPRSVKMPGNL